MGTTMTRVAASSFAVVAAVALLAVASSASAAGDASGHLGSGGTVRGDVSKAPGETDRITIDLDAGATLDLTLKATFQASLVLTDPTSTPVDLGFAGGTRFRTRVQIVDPGTYQLAIASVDGTQGGYTIIAKERWARTLRISGSGMQVIGVPVPAGSKVACVVAAARGAAQPPEILGLIDPNGASLLEGAITPKGKTARLAPTAVAAAGIYDLTIAPTDGSSAWAGRVTRILPHVAPTSLNLTNGLTVVSFGADGVGAFFASHCASCHGFASSYAGVRGHARDALARMASGSMPPGGGVSAGDIGLVRAWIATGTKP